MKPNEHRKYSQGVELVAGGASFRVWAPEHHRVEVVLDGGQTPVPLHEEEGGYFAGLVDGVRAGARYRYRIDGQAPDYPDPVARFLPEGPHGPAEIVDPKTFAWSDEGWAGVPLERAVVYELHIGTFSPRGDFAGVVERLPWLRELGINVLELMPVAEFDGAFGWGYDGVAWYAPSRLYGTPDGLRALVDEAHRLGLAAILDVVYNHWGGSGDYSGKFSRHYQNDAKTEWGSAFNFDGPHAHGLRSLLVDNAAYWIDEFHFDGLRLDAIQAIEDSSREHVVTALARRARAAAPGRRLLLVGENEPEDARLLREHDEPAVGSGLDALWNDDFHHSAVVALTGRRQAYYSDFSGRASEWSVPTTRGFFFQGQHSAWQRKPRGRPTEGLPMHAFITFLENHDQVANSLWGSRLWQESSPAQYRAMTALLLLGPWTPMLFQGQEWGSSAPFQYFAGHAPELARLVKEGRAGFMAQFPGCARHPELLPDPADPETFARCQLRWDEIDALPHARALRLHRDLLRLRATERALAAGVPESAGWQTSNPSAACAVFRHGVGGGARMPDRERLLLVNLGPDLEIPPPTEPLLAPSSIEAFPFWRTMWASEDPAYGGHGASEPMGKDGAWRIPGAAAYLLAPSKT